MTNYNAPRFLVIDGYTRAARDELQSGGASLAADLYVGMLERCAPNGIECDVIFPADLGASLPVGEAIRDYDGVAWTGCSSCVFSGEPDVAEQIEFARECFRRGVPALGCALTGSPIGTIAAAVSKTSCGPCAQFTPTTSAPQSARMPPAAGPATQTPSSITRSPSNGPAMHDPPSRRFTNSRLFVTL